MKNKIVIVLFNCLVIFSFSQDDLINKLKNNQSENTSFQFTITKDLERTDVKNQGSSGTCWSYSGNSFLESEMMKNGKTPVDIAEIYTARNVYLEKAKQFVLFNGAVTWGDGGELHDVINMYKKYGAIPQSAYTGLLNGATKNNFSAMQKELKSILDSVVKIASKGKIDVKWQELFNKKLDQYLGEVPKEFMYNGKYYTPKSFAKEVIGLNANDYVEISSYKDYPYYTPFVLPVPDNWSYDKVENVPMEELTFIIDNAIKNGYTVGWATDVSEPYFSWKNGVAYVPELDLDAITPEQKETLFNAPKPDKKITEDMRQLALNNLTTTDDHGMQIVGLAKDQTGKEYYLVKNSWGDANDYKGYLFVTKPYVQYKSTAIFVNKKALPAQIKSKLKL